MPELPEVETIRRSVIDSVVGRTIVRLRPGGFPGVMGGEPVEEVSRRVAGKKVTSVRRRGKYLFFDLSDDSTLMIHLRMTGRIILADRTAPPIRFEHLAIELDSGVDLRFGDQRKFGRVFHLLPADVAAFEQRIGPEPLSPSFTADRLATGLSRRPGKLKSVLLDQRLIAGIGNIYADEALFHARLHPERAANSLSQSEVRRLHRAIRAVLRASLEHRGTTFSSYQDGYGESGGNQNFLRVYGRGRTGQLCLRCAKPLRHIVVGGRSTHFCPRCQPALTPGAWGMGNGA